MSAILHRTLHPETKILDAKEGLVEYIASDESIDAHREIIRAAGWRFNRVQKNFPFTDSHEYNTIERQLGEVVDWRVSKKTGQLFETVRWAKNVEENRLAVLGWKMTEAGFLKAVSVGFYPTKVMAPWNDASGFQLQVEELGLPKNHKVERIFVEQEQIELSAVVIGANPNAVAKSYKAGALSDQDLESLAEIASYRIVMDQFTEPQQQASTSRPAMVEALKRLERERFLRQYQRTIERL